MSVPPPYECCYILTCAIAHVRMLGIIMSVSQKLQLWPKDIEIIISRLASEWAQYMHSAHSFPSAPSLPSVTCTCGVILPLPPLQLSYTHSFLVDHAKRVALSSNKYPSSLINNLIQQCTPSHAHSNYMSPQHVMIYPFCSFEGTSHALTRVNLHGINRPSTS